MVTTAALQSSEVLYLPIDKISLNPYQPRRIFDKAAIDDLSRSIRQYGVMQPICVRIIGTKYELVAGERRLRASKQAGLTVIPALIVNINDNDSAVLALIENLQRENLNYLEEAEGYLNLINHYSFTQEMVAEKVSKSQSAVANKLRILKLSKEIQHMLLGNGLSERHARALLALDTDEQRMEVLKKVIAHGLTVKKTEDLIKAMLEEKEEKKKNPNIRHFIRDVRLFTNTIKQAVEVMNSSGLPTEYEVEETKDGCFISIAVNYQKKA